MAVEEPRLSHIAALCPFQVHLGRSPLTAYTPVCKISRPRVLEARWCSFDFFQHSSPILKPLYWLHLNFHLRATGGCLPISATHCDTELR